MVRPVSLPKAGCGLAVLVAGVLLLLVACTQTSPTSSPTPTPTGTPTTVVPSIRTPTPTVPIEPTPTRPPSPSPTPFAKVLGWISAPRDPVAPGSVVEAAVVVNPGPLGISSGEATLSFNPQIFEAVDVQPGSLLGSQALVGFRQIDNVAGTVKVAIARTGSTHVPSPSGNFVVTRLKVKDSALAGEYGIGLRLALADHQFKSVAVAVEGGKVTVVK
ncbi:MAG: cohesin domain-containing protein [Chloroflexota bacterium]|nr:cohesin domain-containing protein [Chloroflexota bacterium]